MFAFATPQSVAVSTLTTGARLPSSSNCSRRTSYVPRTARRLRCLASADNGGSEDAGPAFVDDALASGEMLREQLRTITDERREQADRTEKKLQDMSDRLSRIVAQLRAEAGMPPVADPPSEDEEAVASSSTAPSTLTPTPPAGTEDSSSSSDEPYMDPKNFGYESTAGWQVLAESAELPENEGNVDFRIECDMHGCSLIQVKGDGPPGPGVRQKFIQSGSGFRVGYDPDAPKSFCATVGNDSWLIALSYDEMRHFKRLCSALLRKMERIGKGLDDPPVKKPSVRRSGDGMYNERVARAGLDCSVEMESKLVWAQAMGQPHLGQYCIRAIFMESRQSEAFWAPEAAANMLAALSKVGIE